MIRPSPSFPLPFKIAVLAACLAWTAIHLRAYPPATMLWFCAYGNVVLAVGIATESRLLLSIEAVALLIPQSVWSLDALWRLTSGTRGGGTSYLFESPLPFSIRVLSLFHILVPALLLVAIARLGYDRRAVQWQLGIGVAVLLASYAAGPLNVNGVYGPLAGTDALPPVVHLAGALILWPVLCWLPAGVLLNAWDRRRASDTPAHESAAG